MKIDIIKPQHLSSQDLADWQRIQATNPLLDSPFFCPPFTLALAAVRDDVEIAVARNGKGRSAFLPFHRRRLGVARPIGAAISDYNGLISDAGFAIDGSTLLKAAGLRFFKAKNWLAEQSEVLTAKDEVHESFRLDLSRGFPAYINALTAAGSSSHKGTLRKARKLARDVGGIRLVADDLAPASFESAVAWKREQYKRTGAYSVLDKPWVVDALKALCDPASPARLGVVSTLYAGDKPVAAHIGLKSQSTWHYWFPTFDLEFSKYSPGLILLMKMAESAPDFGLQTIDLGYGAYRYKTSLASTTRALTSGRLSRPSLALAGHSGQAWFSSAFEALPVAKVSTLPRRLFERIERRLDAHY